MKTGLVLEGGALRAIFSSGVCDGLLEGGVMTDYVIGVSAGIAYGVSYVSRQPRRNLEVVTRFAPDRRYMGWRNLTDKSNRSYFGLKFGFSTIPNELVPFDYTTFSAFPGAVEAVASTGGQIMPPVMAAVAFIMADYLGVSYLSICKAALIPAVLYYFCLFFMVDAKAIKLNIKVLTKEELPNTRQVVRNGWYLAIPFVVLIGMMFLNYTPMKSGFWALVSLIVIVLIADRKRLSLDKVIQGLKGGATGIISVSATSACAGIIVGVIMLTGLGLKFTSLITTLSGGNLVIAMAIAAVVAIILGMGLPTVPAYIVMSSLVAPALIQMGATPIAAHMFVLYFAVLSCITPPVAIASYAAAAISGADAVKVGFASMKLGIIAYIIPFLFVLNPVLIAQGSLLTVLWTFFTACVGCVALTWAIEGVIDEKISWIWRLACLVAAALTLFPEGISDLLGLACFAVIVFMFKFRGKKAPGEGAAI